MASVAAVATAVSDGLSTSMSAATGVGIGGILAGKNMFSNSGQRLSDTLAVEPWQVCAEATCMQYILYYS
jgi:hypothetical protein